jgi:hypothetical protein
MTLAERVAYARAMLPPAARATYETDLVVTTKHAIFLGDYGPLSDVIEQGWQAAARVHVGQESWRRMQQLSRERALASDQPNEGGQELVA